MKDEPPVCGLFMIGMDAWKERGEEGGREGER